MNLLPRPDKQLFNLPFEIHHGSMAGCIMAAADGALQTNLIDPTLNAASSPGRFKPTFGNLFIASVLHYPKLRSITDAQWGYFTYNEAAVVLLVTDTQAPGGAPQHYWFAPMMILDCVLPLIAGREIYGLPKVFGKIDPGPLVSGSNSTTCTVAVEGFSRQDPNEAAAMQPLASANLLLSLGGVDNPTALSPANFLNTIPSPLGWASDVRNMIDRYIGGLVPGIFLKQFPDVANVGNACQRQLVCADYYPTKIYSLHLHAAQLTLNAPASYPLATLLGLTPGLVPGLFPGIVTGLVPAFSATMDWVLPPGQPM